MSPRRGIALSTVRAAGMRRAALCAYAPLVEATGVYIMMIVSPLEPKRGFTTLLKIEPNR